MTIDIKNKTAAFSKDFIDIFQPANSRHFFTAGQIGNVIDGLNSKNLCDWAQKDLRIGFRDPVTGGWIRFSIEDIIQLLIVIDLRKLGIPLSTISIIMDTLLKSKVTVQTKETKADPTVKLTMREIDYGILSSFKNKRIQLAILNTTQIQTTILTELDFIDYYNNSLGASDPIIILPFFKYVRFVMAKIKEEYLYGHIESPARVLSDNRLSEQNDTIIALIKNKKFDEVIVKPHTGATLHLKAKTHQQGDFSESDIINAILASKYQEVTATVVNGNIIRIVREESILI